MQSVMWREIITFISSLIKKRGKGWFCFLPLNLSGIGQSDELIADRMKDLPIINKVDLQNTIDEVKKSLNITFYRLSSNGLLYK